MSIITQTIVDINRWDDPTWFFDEHLSNVDPWAHDKYQQELYERLYKPLTQAQKVAWGLGKNKKVLVEGTHYVVRRNQDWVWITDKATGIEYKVGVYDAKKDRDQYARFKVYQKDLLSIPGFRKKRMLARLLKTLSEGSDVYLARLVMAVAGYDVYFDLKAPPGDRLNVHHVNFICSCDLIGNHRLVTATQHREIENMALLAARHENGTEMVVAA